MAADTVRLINPTTSAYIDLNGMSMSGCVVGVEATDLRNFPGLRGTNNMIPGNDGGIFLRTGLLDKKATIDLFILATNPNNYRANINSTLECIYDYLYQSNVQILLNPPNRYVIGNCVGTQVGEDVKNNDAIMTVKANFELSDPFSYSNTAQNNIVYRGTMSGLPITVHVSGLVKVYPVIVWTNYGGGLSGIANEKHYQIMNTTNSSYIEYNKGIPVDSGFWLNMDCGQRTMVTNETTSGNLSLLYNLYSPDFLYLSPNQDNILVVTDTAQSSGQLKVQFTDRWYV